VPSSFNQADGNIYWAYLDDENPTVHSLVSVVGQVIINFLKSFKLH
jgi:hypothetical protein